MVKTFLIGAAQAILIIAALDVLILFTALGQVALEGRTGYWSPFWRWQAERVVSLL